MSNLMRKGPICSKRLTLQPLAADRVGSRHRSLMTGRSEAAHFADGCAPLLRLLVTMAVLTEPLSRVLRAEPAGNQYWSVVVQARSVRQCGQRSTDGPIKIYRPEWLRQRVVPIQTPSMRMSSVWVAVGSASINPVNGRIRSGAADYRPIWFNIFSVGRC